ncbi:MAG: hypothetical protein M1820_000247 [Bogoriella megaspora]|nr:MAG: hypothetical protein M1820_000247 [Bogoriella megaspora]
MSTARSISLPFRILTPLRQTYRPQFIIPAKRCFAESKNDTLTEQPVEAEGPNQAQLPHVSQEAAATAKVKGEKGPDLEQGTPVQEVVQNDEAAKEKLPKVVKDSLNPSIPKGSRSFSTSARRRAEISTPLIDTQNDSFLQESESPLPDLKLPRDLNLKHRYDPVVHQITNLLMRDGKLGVAQRNMAMILNHLRTAPPPKPSEVKPLLPGSPPPSYLPLDPVLYMTVVIDSVAPLLRIRSQRGAAGGGVALQIPIPLALRQRRRQAFQWILDAASKRRNSGSGRGSFAHRIAEELIAVAEGRSSVWERRNGVHKLGVSSRANIITGSRRR